MPGLGSRGFLYELERSANNLLSSQNTTCSVQSPILMWKAMIDM